MINYGLFTMRQKRGIWEMIGLNTPTLYVQIHDENFTFVDENVWILVIFIVSKSNFCRSVRLVDEN